MPDDVKPLLRLGPFGGLNTRTAQPYEPTTDAVFASNADTHRFGGALSNVMGRTRFVTFAGLDVTGGTGLVALARFDTSPQVTAYVGCGYVAGPTLPNGIAEAYFPTTATFASLSSITNVWSRAVQSNGNLFLDNGQQVFLGNDGDLHAALWQYPVPNQATQGYTLNTVADPGTQMEAATYSYAFVQQIQLPGIDGTIDQETTPLYLTAQGQPLFSITTNGAQDVQISGTFAGTTPDGYPYVTQVYRESTNVAVWYLLTTLTTNNTYTDSASDQSIAGNQQLTLDNDQPPAGVIDASGFALNPIESFQDRMWVLARVQDASTNYLPQTQLWYSRVGLPWSFDAALQVLLAGDDATMVQTGPFVDPSIYGDTPAGLAKLGSTLLVFKTLSTLQVFGVDQSNYTIVPLFADIGLVAPYSLVKGNGLVIWLSAEGVFSYDGANLQYLSDDIYNALQSYPPNVLRNAVGSYADLTYCLSLPDAAITYEYYIPNKKWLPVPYATNAAAFSPSLPNDSTLASGEPIGGKFNQIAAAEPGTYNVDFWFDGPRVSGATTTAPQELDLGLPITVEWTGPLSDSGSPTAQKNYKYIAIAAPPQAVLATVTLTIDPGFADSPSAFVSEPFDLSLGPTTKIIRVPQAYSRGYSAQLSISAVNASAPSQLGVVTPSGATMQIWSVSVGGSIDRDWSVPS